MQTSLLSEGMHLAGVAHIDSVETHSSEGVSHELVVFLGVYRHSVVESQDCRREAGSAKREAAPAGKAGCRVALLTEESMQLFLQGKANLGGLLFSCSSCSLTCY